MSVVVRMEMPENCDACPMCGTASGGNGMYELWCMCGDFGASSRKRPDNCPIVCTLPENHGRLVDADEAMEKLIHYGFRAIDMTVHECIEDEITTIVPARKERGMSKQRLIDAVALSTRIDKEYAKYGEEYDLHQILSAINDAPTVAAPRWVRLIGPFDVIDRTTGKYPDLEQIALNEDWAKRLIYCDMEGFAMLEDGNLILLDECGNYEYCPPDRFEAIISTEPPKEGE